MQAYANTFAGQLKNGAAKLPFLVVVYGEDGGQASALAKQAVAATGIPPDDPFAAIRVDIEEVYENPAILLDHANTVSFGASKKLVMLKGVTATTPKNQMEALTKAVEMCLETPPAEAFIIIPAPGVEKSTALVRKVEKHPTALAVRCFQDNSRSLPQVVKEALAPKQVRPEAMEFLLENLGADRAVTQNELEKLALYTAKQTEITLEDCLAVVAGAPSISIFKLCDALGSRDARTADRLLHQLLQEGEDVNYIATMAHRHLNRLAQCQQHMQEGKSLQQAMSTLRPPVNFGKDEFAAQVNKYPTKRLKTLSQRFYALQLQSRQGVVPPQLATLRNLLGLSL